MKISKIAFAVTALIAASQVNAAGFQINEHSASGLGRANSGEAAIGDNAAAVGRNPALMARFEKAQLSLVGTYIMPEVNMRADDVTTRAGTQSGRNEDVAPDAAVPAMYYIQPLSDDFAFGLAIYSGFGMSTEYEDDYVYGSSGGTTEIVTMNFNPNFSYRLNDSLSVGVGVDFVYATAELKRNSGVTNPTVGLTPTTSIAYIEGDGYGIGWNAGVLYEINENNRLGVSYRSKVKLELEGNYNGTSSPSTPNPFGAQHKVAGELDINLPSVLEVSAYHKLTDSFAIMYDWQYTTWSDFGDIEANSVDASDCKEMGSNIQGRCLTKETEFEDSNRYALGAEFYPSESVTLRLGYAFDEQAAKSTLSIPDSDRQWFTAGMTLAPSDTLSFDLAAAYILGKEGSFDEEVPMLKTHKTFESTSSDAYIFSVQMNYSF